MDGECLHFDLDEDSLLDDSEEVFMVDTCSFSLNELSVRIVSQDVGVEKGEALEST